MFVTVGTQLPFIRLISAMDIWATRNPTIRVVGQIGSTDYVTRNIEVYDYLTPSDYKKIVKETQVIVGHLGTGTIASAYENNKPAVLMPRIQKLNEHRNEHQLEMAKKFDNRQGIYIAHDNIALFNYLNNLDKLVSAKEIDANNRKQLINFISSQINN